MSNQKNQLAALMAGLEYQTGTRRAETQRETEAEFQARMVKRAQRIAHKTEALDRDELAQRYAWTLLLACEFRSTNRQLESLTSTHKRFVNHLQLRADALESVAHDTMRDVVKSEIDRKRGAAVKLAKDPKQAAKKEAFKEWQDWQAGRAIHKNQSQFAQHIVKKFPILESPKQVASWATKWRREAHSTK